MLSAGLFTRFGAVRWTAIVAAFVVCITTDVRVVVVAQEATPEERKKIVPRVVIVGGKAASAYYMAKKIVKLVNAVGQKVPSPCDPALLPPIIICGRPSVSRPRSSRAMVGSFGTLQTSRQCQATTQSTVCGGKCVTLACSAPGARRSTTTRMWATC